MRRNNFWIGALVAIITFVTLSAFVHHPWGWHGRGHGRWSYDDCYYHDNRHAGDNEKNQDGNKTPVSDSTNY
jgi:hypothetical protein